MAEFEKVRQSRLGGKAELFLGSTPSDDLDENVLASTVT